MKVNVLILNYNGEKLIPECLPSIIEAKRASNNDVKVTVIDNDSSDNSLDVLQAYVPEIDIIPHENQVYSSYNDIAQMLDDDVIIILNNDIKVERTFIDPLVSPFSEDDDIFFVSARCYSFDKSRYEGDKARACIKWGIFEPCTIFKGYERAIEKSGHTFSAGVGAFDREKFVGLGGYDHIYLPGRYEDVDLCYRAWKTGWKGVYQPESVMYHKGAASFKKKYKEKQIFRTVFRNSIIFTVKNVTNRLVLGKAAFLTLVRMCSFLVRGKFYMILGAVDAVKMFPEALKRREVAIETFTKDDMEVIEEVNKKAE